MPWFRCPCCQKWVYSTEVADEPPPESGINLSELSPVAYAIVTAPLPAPFRQGEQPLVLRTLAGLIGYSSHEHVRQGLLELQTKGVVQSVPYGPRNRRAHYSFVPKKLQAAA